MTVPIKIGGSPPLEERLAKRGMGREAFPPVKGVYRIKEDVKETWGWRPSCDLTRWGNKKAGTRERTGRLGKEGMKEERVVDVQ